MKIDHNELPEPCKHNLQVGERYYFPDLMSREYYDTWLWEGKGLDQILLERGMVYKTQEDAIAHAMLLLSLSERGAG